MGMDKLIDYFEELETTKEYDGYFCSAEDRNIQQNLNMIRKLALNIIKQYKLTAKSKKAISKIISLNIFLSCYLSFSAAVVDLIGMYAHSLAEVGVARTLCTAAVTAIAVVAICHSNHSFL